MTVPREQQRYWLKINDAAFVEVSMVAFVAAERLCGFHNTMGRPDLPATAGFGWTGLSGDSVRGRVTGLQEPEPPTHPSLSSER